MNHTMKLFIERFLVSALNAGATTLVGMGWLNEDQVQGFVGAAFFLVAWAVDTFIVKRGKERAAVAGGQAVADVVPQDISHAEVKAIVKEGTK